MRKDRQTHTGRRPRLYQRIRISKRLTPNECQALGFVVGLFLLGMLVRWYRLAHLR